MSFCCAFFFRGLKPTARNIEPPTRFQANVSHLFLKLRELCELRVSFFRELTQPGSPSDGKRRNYVRFANFITAFHFAPHSLSHLTIS